jgi:hypothetical protein
MCLVQCGKKAVHCSSLLLLAAERYLGFTLQKVSQKHNEGACGNRPQTTRLSSLNGSRRWGGHSILSGKEGKERKGNTSPTHSTSGEIGSSFKGREL